MTELVLRQKCSSRCLRFLLTTFQTCTSFRSEVQRCDTTMRSLTVPFPLHFHFHFLLPSDSTVSSLQQWGSGSAGLNVLRDALLKAQGPISLVQMHRVSLKFHANRHILFKQLRGYPQEEARPPLSVLLVSFSWNHQSWDVQDGAEWLGQQSSIRNILAAIFTPLRMCLRSFYVTEKAQFTTFRANAHISLLLTCCTSMIYAYWDIYMQRTCL